MEKGVINNKDSIQNQDKTIIKLQAMQVKNIDLTRTKTEQLFLDFQQMSMVKKYMYLGKVLSEMLV